MITVIVGPAAADALDARAGAPRDVTVVLRFDDDDAIDEDAVAARAHAASMGGSVKEGAVVVDVVIGGFPRSAAQAHGFTKALARRDLAIGAVVLADADDAEIVRGRALRRVCPACNARFHLDDAPPGCVDVCDRCAHEGLVLRDDDTPAGVKRALPAERERAAEIWRALRDDGARASVDAHVIPDAERRRAEHEFAVAHARHKVMRARVMAATVEEKKLAVLIGSSSADDPSLAELRATTAFFSAHAEKTAADLERWTRELQALAMRSSNAKALRTVAELSEATVSLDLARVLARFRRVVDRSEDAARAMYARVEVGTRPAGVSSAPLKLVRHDDDDDDGADS